jgi:cell division protein ZapA (FtsZ GTPase activity inhibitor)
MSAQQVAVLVAFNLAEELLAEQERKRLLKRRVTDSTERLIKRVEAHLVNTSGRL